MHAETKKLHLIEELLKVENDFVLSEIENILKKFKTSQIQPKSFKDFVGKIEKADIDDIEHQIESGCEQINKDDWS